MNTTTKTEAGMKMLKDMGTEVASWENRLMGLKNDVENLRNQKAALQTEAENIRAMLTVDVEKKMGLCREEARKVNEAKERVEADRALLKDELVALRTERNAFERDKTAILDMKKNSEEQLLKVGQFIRLVRTGAEGL